MLLPVSDVAVPDLFFLQELTTVEYPYTLALSLIRISIAVLLLRVFSAANWFRWAGECK